MKAHVKFAFALVVVGLLAMAGWRVAQPYLKANTQTEITDGSTLKDTINIAIDGWVGYFPLCSPEIKKRLRRDGYGLQCVDDSANYQERFKKLDKNEYHFAVATVDSYVLNGVQRRYPGAIVAVLDESKGGDAIVARRSVVATLEGLKQTTQVNIAYTPDSPSHHLVKSIAAHFDIPVFKDRASHLKTDGSEAAYRALMKGQADVAVLWEPDVSRALEDKDFVRLLGTEDTQQLIVDILIASRDVAKNDEVMVKTLLKHYFKTLKFYTDNSDQLVQDLARYSDIKKAKVKPLLDGVEWVNLSGNAEKWYSVTGAGFAEHALTNSIESAVDILIENQDFDQNPLPNRDPYSLIASQFIAELYEVLGKSGGWAQAGSDTNANVNQFAELSEAQWSSLQEIGSLKARKIAFASGTSELTSEGQLKIDELVKDLKHYPSFRVEVRGHTGVRGDPQVNLALSRDRAEAVIAYMLGAHEVAPARVRALGFGGERPLVKKQNESSRAYRYRLPRVELVLVRETI